jgi:ATP-dependent RNA helicase HelY
MEIAEKKRRNSNRYSNFNRGRDRNPQKDDAFVPPVRKLHGAAEKLLADIGRPEPAPFVPDPFQMEALDKILTEDVLVSAPTGSGKTWIAMEATRAFLSKPDCGIWYATPLKALSNSKYEEFGDAFGPENVGILTGDRKENHNAPIIVGTTEILRNQLYDAMQTGIDLRVDLVILDEAHYLGDIDRGVVWEEVLIYLPPRVRILLLSATISNAREVSKWLTHIRGASCAVVQSDVRPVPLHILFRTPDDEVTPFFRGARFFPTVAEHLKRTKGRSRFADPAPDMNEIIDTLREFNLLPAIIFLKSRAECDRALDALSPSPQHPNDGGFADFMREFLEPYPELRNQRQLNRLLACRGASHHAGQLPGWRLLIEKSMILGHLEVIFSTSTVAAGVNFPARTVVLLQSDRFNGRAFVDMTSTDIHQMTGRAGRRGMDKAGFALVVPGKFMNIGVVKDLLQSQPEPLQSRIAINFSMTLNLLLSHDPEGVESLLGFSFAAFRHNQRSVQKISARITKEFHKHLHVLQELQYIDDAGVPTYDGKWAAQLRLDHPLLIAELIRSGEFKGLSPQDLAALIAPFVIDKDKDITISREAWDRTRHLWTKFKGMIMNLKPLAQFMIARGFDIPAIMFWPAASAYLWADQLEWEELANHIGADEGDLAMLMLRTADHLRQICSLQNEEPELAATARQAIQMLVRLPLI